MKNNFFLNSDAALNDFYKAMKKLNDYDYTWFGGYGNRFGEEFMNNVEEFISSLTLYSCKGSWFNDYRCVFSFSHVFRDLLKWMKGKKIGRLGWYIEQNCGDGIINYSFPSETEFYSRARVFIKQYFDMVCEDRDGVVLFDQLLQPQQLYRIPLYFDDDIRFIVVDRDPRDLFIISKYIWSLKTGHKIFPDDPAKFSEFYKRLLETERKIEDSRILRVHFEDLIYNYDKTKTRLEEFIGKENLGEHIYLRRFFNPEISIKNTQNFNICVEWESEVQFIKNNMQSNIYKFPYRLMPKLSETSDPDPDTSCKNDKKHY